MRQLTAIFFLLLFLFNIAGYNGLFFFLNKSADARLAEKILAGNDLEKDLILVKIPFNVPYLDDSKDYESMEGEMNVNGTIYSYVKRKIARDTVFLLCIENKERASIEKKRAEYFSKVNDLDAGATKKTGAKQHKVDYYIKNAELSIKKLYLMELPSPYSFVVNFIPNGHYCFFGPPPEYQLS